MKSVKGHRKAQSLQRQMGRNPPQRKRTDTKITHFSFVLLCQSFPSDSECVILSLFMDTNEHIVYLSSSLLFYLSPLYYLAFRRR